MVTEVKVEEEREILPRILMPDIHLSKKYRHKCGPQDTETLESMLISITTQFVRSNICAALRVIVRGETISGCVEREAVCARTQQAYKSTALAPPTSSNLIWNSILVHPESPVVASISM